MSNISENTYFKAKSLNPQLKAKQTLAEQLKIKQGLSKLSNFDYVTEPTTGLDLQVAMTDRSHNRTTKPYVRLLKDFEQNPPEHLLLNSPILNDEKVKLQSKFRLLDSFSQRNSTNCIYETGVGISLQYQTPRKKTIQLPRTKLNEYEETRITLKRNIFLYTMVQIKDKHSPVAVSVLIREGVQNSKMRIFASTKFLQPNRFNAELEVSGRLLKFSCEQGDVFQQENLYLSILAQHDLETVVRVEFARPQSKMARMPREFDFTPQHFEFTPNLEELVQEILERRRFRQSNQNFVQKNRQCSRFAKSRGQGSGNAELQSLVEVRKFFEIRSKIKDMEFQNKLKRTAQLKLHDVAKEIHCRQVEMKKQIQHREFVQKAWLQTLLLINVLTPAIFEFISAQRTIVAKNFKKEVYKIQFFNKIQRMVHSLGPSISIRIVAQSKGQAHVQTQVLADVWAGESPVREAEGGLDRERPAEEQHQGVHDGEAGDVCGEFKCITRLVKHKNSRVQYISDLKLYLTQQYKVLYQDAVRYSKQTETSKNKRDPIHFFLHDNSFIHQMTKRLLKHVFDKWNHNFTIYRLAIQEEKEMKEVKGMALFWQPPKLFELPHDNVIRMFLFEELEKKGLINGDFRV